MLICEEIRNYFLLMNGCDQCCTSKWRFVSHGYESSISYIIFRSHYTYAKKDAVDKYRVCHIFNVYNIKGKRKKGKYKFGMF